MKKFVTIVVIFVLGLLSAETHAFPDGDETPDDGGHVRGTVLESGTTTPVEYANIIVFNPADSSMITGGLSDAEGSFKLKDIPYGEYYLVVDFIGYNKQVISNLVIDENNRHVNLGTIQLQMAAIELAGAEITASKMAVEFRLDRKVINVDQDLDAAGTSAVQILEKAPSVRVDLSGEVFLRGSSSFTVLIDGKPSVLQGSEALQQIPANSIENIEIITNPSVKYDPDGTAGIINIVLKKNRLDGLSGVVNATAGTGDKYATDLSLNYKAGRFNVIGGFEWNDRQFPWEDEQFREKYGEDTTSFRESFGTGGWMRNGLKARGSVEYAGNKNTTYTFGGEYGNFGFGMDNYQYITEYSDPKNTTRRYINDDKRRWKRNYYSLTGNVKKDFEGEGHTLTFFGFYSNRDGSEIQDKTEFDTDEDWNSIDEFPLLLRSNEAGPSHTFRFESDYARPLGEQGKMEVGYHFRGGFEDENAMLETWDYDLGAWVEDPDYTKYSEYRRTIHAVYGIYSSSYKSFQYQLGLRGEYTYREIRVTNTDEISLVDRFDYFPSVHLSNRFDDKNQVMASYSRRINRPRGYYLEPYVTYIDDDTRRVGNPALLPEYTDSYEVGYLRTLAAGTFSADVYYRRTNNKITSIQSLDPSTGILYIQYQNLNNDQATGVEGSLIYDLTKWMNINLSGTFYNYRLDDRTSNEGGIKTSNNWDAGLIAGFKLPSSTGIQLSFNYNSPTVAAQGTREEVYFANVTLRQDFLKKQLNLTLRVDDVFGTRRQITETRGEDFYIYEYRQRETQIVTLTVSYRLNNFKEKSARRMDSGGDM